MSRYRTVLEQIGQGQSIEAVRDDLDLRDDVLTGMIQSMLREGHLNEFGCEGDSCSACPMSGSCPMGSIQGPSSYMVTKQGREFIVDGQQASD